jgi:hypothetical protein
MDRGNPHDAVPMTVASKKRKNNSKKVQENGRKASSVICAFSRIDLQVLASTIIHKSTSE